MIKYVYTIKQIANDQFYIELLTKQSYHIGSLKERTKKRTKDNKREQKRTSFKHRFEQKGKSQNNPF